MTTVKTEPVRKREAAPVTVQPTAMKTLPGRSGALLLFAALLSFCLPGGLGGAGTAPEARTGSAAAGAEPPPAPPSPVQSGRVGETTVPLHPEAEEAIGRLRSPWCPGFMLEVCPSPTAAAFRDTLRMMAQEGIEADSLVAWALAQHGEEWRALPEAEGAGLLAWFIPPLVLVLGIGVVVVVLRRLRRGPGGSASGEGGTRELSEEEERRLAAALKDFEGEGR